MNLDIKQFYPSRKLSAYFESKSSFEEAWNDCERNDWMLWIAYKLKVDDRLLTKAKALCANVFRHLMEDKRCTDAIDAALRYADGEISREELEKYKIDAIEAYVDVPDGEYNPTAAACMAVDTDLYFDASFDADNTNVYSGVYLCSFESDIPGTLKLADIHREVLTDAVFEKVKQLNNN
jgi:hypothetical protein